MNKFINLTGKKINEWTFISYEGNKNWVVVCSCGKKKIADSHNIRKGKSKSCGCKRKNRLRHGMTGTKQHQIWNNMINRCKYKSTDSYHLYGGRGIKVCGRWKLFDNFWEDMGDGYKDGLSIDRINNNFGYFKDNCKWSTRTEQANNKRNTVYLAHNGTTLTISGWAKKIGIKRATLANRYYSCNWSVDKILKTPVSN